MAKHIVAEGSRELAAALREKSEAQLNCRGFAHAWNPTSGFRLHHPKDGPPYMTRTFECMRGCGVHRVDEFAVRRRSGGWQIVERVRSSRDYPKDYQIHGVPRDVRRSEVIANEQLRRAGIRHSGTDVIG